MTWTPRHVAFVSYGNDSIALLQWMHEHNVLDVLCVYHDTGWASKAWPARVEKGEHLAHLAGFRTRRTESEGLVQLARRKKGWPAQGMQFCTEELKIAPAQALLAEVDPLGEVICVNGVRREESRERSTTPEWVEESEKHGGRSLWSPLVTVREPERDALIRRAGFQVLPHGSRECYPCVNSNKGDLRLLDEERVAEIEAIEATMGHTSKGKPRVMFRPHRCRGAVGIREVKKWAESDRGQYVPPVAPDEPVTDEQEQGGGGCDSGFCGT